jgi:hypothetical protein
MYVGGCLVRVTRVCARVCHQTTNEGINEKKYNYLRAGPGGRNVFNRGIRENLKEVCSDAVTRSQTLPHSSLAHARWIIAISTRYENCRQCATQFDATCKATMPFNLTSPLCAAASTACCWAQLTDRVWAH